MTFMQLFFAFSTYFTFKNIYHDWYMSFYNLLFTGFFIPFNFVVNKDLEDSKHCKENNLLIESYIY